jgi:imidazole glycerol-phosphate synthase subunit HisF
MLRKRLVPILLLKEGGLMKSKMFSDWKYIGDPINTAKIFNDKDTDELVVLDVDATRLQREPDFEFLKELAAECFLPICYGGGVTSVEIAKKVSNCGIDKVALNTAQIESPEILRQVSEVIGSSSTVASLDVKDTQGGYQIRNHPTIDLLAYLSQLESLGAGEVMIQSVDRDGTRGGPDLALAEKILQATKLPVVFGGGVSSLEDVQALWKLGIDAVAAGAWFVYSGKHEAVLVNYPARKKIDEALESL